MGKIKQRNISHINNEDLQRIIDERLAHIIEEEKDRDEFVVQKPPRVYPPPIDRLARLLRRFKEYLLRV